MLLSAPVWIGLDTPFFDAAMFAVAALWLVFGAPAVFIWLGLRRHAAMAR